MSSLGSGYHASSETASGKDSVYSSFTWFYQAHPWYNVAHWALCKCTYSTILSKPCNALEMWRLLTLACKCAHWSSEIVSNVLRPHSWSPIKTGSKLISSVAKGYFTMSQCFELVNEVLHCDTQRSAGFTEACQDLLGKSICSLISDVRRGEGHSERFIYILIPNLGRPKR